MHYLLCREWERKTSKKKASEAYLQLSQQEVKTKQKKEKSLSPRSSLTFCMRSITRIFYISQFFLCLLSRLFFGCLRTRVIVELARASKARCERKTRKKNEKERENWEQLVLCAFFVVGGSYKRNENFTPWYHSETCSQSESLVHFFNCKRIFST